jgi:hypothetical protein
MKLKINNASITQLFTLVQNVSEVKKMIENQECVLTQIEIEIKELHEEEKRVVASIVERANLLRQGSQDGLKELLHLQWLQEESSKKIASAEMRKAGVSTAISLLDDELISYQKQIDATLQGHN